MWRDRKPQSKKSLQKLEILGGFNVKTEAAPVIPSDEGTQALVSDTGREDTGRAALQRKGLCFPKSVCAP